MPLWPSSRQGTYHNLASGEDLPLQDTPTPGTGMSATYKSLLTPEFTPSQAPYTPGLQDSTANTPAIEQLKYDEETPRKRTWFGHGWRGGARLAFTSMCATLCINIILFAVFIRPGITWMGGFPIVYRGTCKQAEQQNTLYHVFINILSTAMLAASNYCMQLLCAPNRTNIDNAHAHGVWLDIGIPSIRNLRFLTWKRRGLWLALCFSSIPLHLIYNSAFYAAIASNEYNILYATEDFLNNGQYNSTRFPETTALNATAIQQDSSNYTRMSNLDCIKAYSEDFVTEYKTVIAVVHNTSQGNSGSLLDVYVNDLPPAKEFNSSYNSFAWICNDTTVPPTNEPCRETTRQLQKTANSRWNSGGFDISYCMVEKLEQQECHLHFAPHFMGPVIVLNIVKCLVGFYVAFRLRDTPIVTLGDAIESFIKHPDPYTRGMCLATAHEMAHQFSMATHHTPILRATTFDGTRHRWFKVVTKRQWALLGILFLIMFAGLIVGLIAGIAELNPSTLSNAIAIDFGAVEAQNLVFGARPAPGEAAGVLLTALLANTPQAFLSLLYVIYNTIFTLMHIGEDWDMYGAHTATTRHKLKIVSRQQTHRYLRVSNPKGTQKSTHFLNLPFRFAIPLVCASGLIHWFMSQTLYLANISVVPRDNEVPMKDEITTVAYAPAGMIALLIMAVLMVVVLIVTGMRRFGGQMPIVASNSAAISAACHVQMPERRRRAMVLRKIAWGEVPGEGANIPLAPSESLASVMNVAKGLGIDNGTAKNAVYSAEDFSDVIDRDEEFGDDQGSEYQVLRGRAETVDRDGSGRSTAVAHCTFSDSYVFKAETGKFYG